jgi:hypothetical protein
VSLPRAIGVVLATAACARPTENDEALAPAHVQVDPPSVYFGLVQWGETATQELSLTNDGDMPAEVTLVDPSNALTIDDAGAFEIEPGTTSTHEIRWTPSTYDGLSTRLEVLGPDRPYTELSVTGGTVYPIADMSFEPHDFGDVPLGCEPRVSLPVVNEGLGELVLSATSKAGFSVRDALGQSLDTPLVVGPRSTVNLDVTFGPLTAGTADAVLALTTNDPSLPLLELDLRGQGVENERETTEWSAGWEPLTVVVQVNHSVLSLTLGKTLEAFLGTFFDALNAHGATYRVAFILGAEVGGDVPYVDDSFASADAVDAARAMLTYPSGVSDNDAGLETCLQFVGGTDWAVADAGWPNPKLNAVVMNTDAEQSGSDATYYIQRLRDVWGSSNFAVHGIAGDVPSGCTGEIRHEHKGGEFAAEPSPVLEEAVSATGGLFQSVCDPDWAHMGEALAEACMTWRGFYFPRPVGPNGMDVYVDDVLQVSGWSYDRAAYAIVFDDAARPADGAVVRAEYYLGDDCE